MQCLSRQTVFREAIPAHCAKRKSRFSQYLLSRRCWVCAAGPEPSKASTNQEDSRVEQLEANIRKGRKAAAAATPKAETTTQTERPASSAFSDGVRAKWKEGELFPEGFEQMNLGQKLYELYTGERGLLFWANKAAYASIFLLIGGWVLFRFVGPTLGVYKLAGDVTIPSL